MRDRLFARLGIGSKLALACSALAGATVVVVIPALLAGWNVMQDIDLAVAADSGDTQRRAVSAR